jgi:hypothetical protein
MVGELCYCLHDQYINVPLTVLLHGWEQCHCVWYVTAVRDRDTGAVASMWEEHTALKECSIVGRMSQRLRREIPMTSCRAVVWIRAKQIVLIADNSARVHTVTIPKVRHVLMDVLSWYAPLTRGEKLKLGTLNVEGGHACKTSIHSYQNTRLDIEYNGKIQ